MNLHNDTRWPHATAVLQDKQARTWWVLLVKASFRLSTGEALAVPEPVRLVDELAPSGAVHRPGELSLRKTGTDILCLGHVYAPSGQPCRSCVARVRVGPVQASIRATGHRRWERAGDRLVPSQPEPFTRLPLGFEQTYGGAGYASNPAGVGYLERAEDDRSAGSPLPLLEWAGDDPIASPHDRRQPAGFGAVAAHWEPRRSLAGTYGEEWKRRRAPLLPDDFDDDFFQVGQVKSAEPLLGGEPFGLENLAPGGTVTGSLPRVLVRTLVQGVQGDTRRRTVRPTLDLVLLEPEANRVSLVLRTSLDVTGSVGRWPAARIVEKRLQNMRGRS